MPAKPSVTVDTTAASSQHGPSLDGLSAASLLAYDEKAKQYNQSIIEKSKYCCTQLYSSSSTRSKSENSMQDLITTWTVFEKSDSRYNYGIGDESIYLPHPGDSKLDIEKIKRQFAEYLSEPGHTTLSTFVQALADTRKSGSAYNVLGVALHNVNRYRGMPEDEREAYWEWKEDMEAKAGGVGDGDQYRVSGAAPSFAFDQSRIEPYSANDLQYLPNDQ